jgi:hypothetical protein
MMLYNEDQIIERLCDGAWDDYVETMIEEGRYDEMVLRRARKAANIYLEIADKMSPASP